MFNAYMVDFAISEEMNEQPSVFEMRQQTYRSISLNFLLHMGERYGWNSFNSIKIQLGLGGFIGKI